MNIIFGAQGPRSQKFANQALAFIRREYTESAPRDKLLEAEKPEAWYLAALNDGGVVTGRAEENGIHMLLIGWLHGPFPGEDTAPGDGGAQAEYLLGRYREKGSSFLDEIEGHYAAILFDEKQDRLILAADPTGLRTLFIYQNREDEQIYFSSHLLTLAEGMGPEAKLDQSLEDFFLIYGFRPNHKTPYQNITSLSAGEMLIIEGKKTTRSSIHSRPVKDYKSLMADWTEEEPVIEALHDSFLTSLKEQCPDSVKKVGVLLGGFDSALVAAGLHRLGKEVETFSFHYEKGMFNQPHTDTLAKHLGIKHHWIPITPQIIERGLEKFGEIFNFPTNWANYVIQTYEVVREMRQKGITHCYSGDGCDGVFLGYPGVHFRAKFFSKVRPLPRWLLKVKLFFLRPAFWEYLLGRVYVVGLNILRTLARQYPERGFLTFRILDEFSLDHLYGRRDKNRAAKIDRVVQELARGKESLTPDRLAYMGKAMVSPNKSKMVGSADANGVAILSPYLHPDLKALATALPDELCRPKEKTPSVITGKYILMKMAEVKGLLPKEVIYQKKMAAVDSPIDQWFSRQLKPLSERKFYDLPFPVNKTYTRHLLREKWINRFYRRYLSPDYVTSHGASLLTTYAAYTRGHEYGPEPE